MFRQTIDHDSFLRYVLCPRKVQSHAAGFAVSHITFKISGMAIEVVKHFTYLSSRISSDPSLTEEVQPHIAKARVAFANLHHFWRCKNASMGLKDRVYRATVRAVLLYGSETWPVPTNDLKRLKVFDNRCLKTISGVRWRSRTRNAEVHRLELGAMTGHSIKDRNLAKETLMDRPCTADDQQSDSKTCTVCRAAT